MQKSATSSPSGKRFKANLSPDQPISCDVLIIGAGYTGCSAAHNLYYKHDIKDIHVVDSFSHLGGRAFSYSSESVTDTAGHALPNLKDGQPNWYENGAQYIGRDQKAIYALIKDLGMEADLQNGVELRKPWKEKVTVLEKRYSYENGLFGQDSIPPNMSFLDNLTAGLGIMHCQSVEREINVLEPWNSAADVLKYDNITMEEFLDRLTWMTPNAKQLINLSVQAPLSVDPKEISGAASPLPSPSPSPPPSPSLPTHCHLHSLPHTRSAPPCYCPHPTLVPTRVLHSTLLLLVHGLQRWHPRRY